MRRTTDPQAFGRRWIRWRRRVTEILFRRHAEAELDEELRYHLDRKIDEQVAAGLTPDDARYAALRTMGGIEQRREECRDQRRLPVIELLTHDVRDALRTLRRSPGFALLGVLVMALGIGANTAVFSVVNAVLLQPLAYSEPSRIVTLSTSLSPNRASGSLYAQVSIPDVRDWHDQSTAFEAMAYFASRQTSVGVGPAAEYARAARVSAEFFRVFDVMPVIGRGFSAEEQQPRSGGAALAGYAYAQRHFGDPARAIGRTLRLYERTVTIVGVLPAGFDYPSQTEVWIPIDTITRDATSAESRAGLNYLAIGRLKPNVGLAQAQAELTAIAARLAHEYPKFNKDRGVAVTRLQDAMVGDVRLTLYLLLGTVALVLLIACANMATLLLAKATARAQELAVRAALGASRSRLVRQLLVEGLVQALIAGAVGLLVAVWGTKALLAIAPTNVPRLANASVDGYVLAFTLVVCVLVSLLFGLPPALQASRVDLNSPLRAGTSRAVIGGRAGLLRGALVVAEVALAVVLLAGGGLLLRSFLALQQASLGFRPQQVLVMDATVPASSAEGRQRADALFKDLLAEISAMPGVAAAGATMAPPGRVESNGGYWVDQRVSLAVPAGGGAVYSIAAPGTFAALGIPLRRGRDFADSDTQDTPMVTVINEALARQAFGDRDPLGHTIGASYDSFEPMTIVGVVGDVRQYGPGHVPSPEIYMPYLQHRYNNTTLSVVVRSAAEPGALADTLRRMVRARSADVPVRFATMDDLLAENVAAPRFRAWLVGLFGAVALCLAMAGVYGIMAYVVGQRAHEIGLRMALGATSAGVLWMLLRQGVVFVGIGLALGLAGAFAATRLFGTLLFEVKPGDPATYASVAVLLGAMALLAIYVPARRSLAGDPLAALRQE